MKTATLFRRFALFLWLFFWIPMEEGPSEAATPTLSEAKRDSLIVLGQRQVDAGELNKAVETFTRLVAAFPEDADLRTRLGYVYLSKEDLKAAKAAFQAAKKLDKNLAAAYVGLGLVYAETPVWGMVAFHNYRRARGEAKRALKIDSTYAPTYRLLGEIYERFPENHEKAIQHYLKYVELEPDNPDGLYYFGLACVQAKQFDKIDSYVAPYLQTHPWQARLLPLVAQSHFFQERYDHALEYFERYLQNIEEQEHQLYTDISFVASKVELQDYEALSDEADQHAYLKQFWVRRDPDILTRINERIIEHYRRVWYALTFFADKIHPWDRRGEVYIRFGEPNYRSRSYQRNFKQSLEVDAVRTRMAINLYGPEATLLTFTGPVYPIKAHRHPYTQRKLDQLSDLSNNPLDDPLRGENISSDPIDNPNAELAENPFDGGGETPDINPGDRERYEDKDGARFDEYGNLQTRLNFDGYLPVTIHTDAATVPWETWTYTQLQGGVEFVFTDERSNGQFDFAPIPPITPLSQQALASRVTQYAPVMIYQNTAAETPDYYRPGILGPVLDFYYDLAKFRGSNGQTTVEVYYGIPPQQVQMAQQADSAQIRVQCALALADEGHTTLYRNIETFTYEGSNDFNKAKGAFLPELLKVQVPPGKYELQVQLKDLKSGHTGRYKQALEVPDYGVETLQTSDIQLASAIGDTGSAGKFRKGDLWVVPMPTRNYGEKQKIYVYYEIYNLEKNTFGQTRYEVKYLIRSIAERSGSVVGRVSSGFDRLFNRKKPQVSVTYTQVGSEPTEQEYFEIDLSKAKPGVQILEAKIKDLVSGKSTNREIRFRYGG